MTLMPTLLPMGNKVNKYLSYSSSFIFTSIYLRITPSLSFFKSIESLFAPVNKTNPQILNCNLFFSKPNFLLAYPVVRTGRK